MTNCPCGTGRDYGACCGRYIEGVEKAPTAEALMRSRYTAYTKTRISYLTETMDPRSRRDHDPEQARQWAESSRWRGLEIVSVEKGGDGDSAGVVEFVASYSNKDGDHEHHERATFRRKDGTWYFVDGKVIGPEPIRLDAPKIGRNDPCSCGSGKKYKKCCGR